MRRLRLSIEGHRDLANASALDVEAAVSKMASTTGPTYVVVEDGKYSYMQAAGLADRYVIESRDSFGEGFCHWRAATPGPQGAETTIHYRNKCLKGEHPPRGCPLTVFGSEVRSLADVRLALVRFAATGERHPEFVWQNVSVEFSLKDIDQEIREIRPRGKDAPPTE